MLRWLLPSLGVLCSAAVLAAEKPPALLEPYAGYDVVFAPHGRRVLGPDAAQAVERLFGDRKSTRLNSSHT